MTFNNTLENIDDKYYWFLSEENGLDVIKKDRVITMVCELINHTKSFNLSEGRVVNRKSIYMVGILRTMSNLDDEI